MIRLDERLGDYSTRTLRNRIVEDRDRPSYNRKVANELRLRGYEVSLKYSEVKKKRCY